MVRSFDEPVEQLVGLPYLLENGAELFRPDAVDAVEPVGPVEARHLAVDGLTANHGCRLGLVVEFDPEPAPLTNGAQAVRLDRFGNINTTVIGPYGTPTVRLPGGGGAPEIATSCREVFITLKQARRAMVETIDFFTSFGRGRGGTHRADLGIATAGPTLLVTDLALWRPDPETKEFTVVSLHPGVTRGQVQDTCGWAVRFAEEVAQTPPPSDLELETLRALQARTARAHSGAGRGASTTGANG